MRRDPRRHLPRSTPYGAKHLPEALSRRTVMDRVAWQTSQTNGNGAEFDFSKATFAPSIVQRCEEETSQSEKARELGRVGVLRVVDVHWYRQGCNLKLHKELAFLHARLRARAKYMGTLLFCVFFVYLCSFTLFQLFFQSSCSLRHASLSTALVEAVDTQSCMSGQRPFRIDKSQTQSDRLLAG